MKGVPVFTTNDERWRARLGQRRNLLSSLLLISPSGLLLYSAPDALLARAIFALFSLVILADLAVRRTTLRSRLPLDRREGGTPERLIRSRAGRRATYRETAKRVVDYVIAAPLLLLFGPLVGICVVLIKIIDPGPAFFRHERVGRHGWPIEILKLRSMYLDAEAMLEAHLARDPAAREEWRRRFKLRRDPRILPVIGRFLRRSSLDEVPQLWNVLKGEMTLVGPRPLPRYHVEEYPEAFRAARETVLPGLTGLWQISTRSDGDLEALERLDTVYLRAASIRVDLCILFATVRAVLLGKGAC
jgi:lipopolysaccharide/colanic/teichoic acid biosynthesis glycosyltransferase